MAVSAIVEESRVKKYKGENNDQTRGPISKGLVPGATFIVRSILYWNIPEMTAFTRIKTIEMAKNERSSGLDSCRMKRKVSVIFSPKSLIF